MVSIAYIVDVEKEEATGNIRSVQHRLSLYS